MDKESAQRLLDDNIENIDVNLISHLVDCGAKIKFYHFKRINPRENDKFKYVLAELDILEVSQLMDGGIFCFESSSSGTFNSCHNSKYLVELMRKNSSSKGDIMKWIGNLMDEVYSGRELLKNEIMQFIDILVCIETFFRNA